MPYDIKVVADAWEATLRKTHANCVEMFGKLGYTWGHNDIISLRPLPEHKFAPCEHVIDARQKDQEVYLVRLSVPPIVSVWVNCKFFYIKNNISEDF